MGKKTLRHFRFVSFIYCDHFEGQENPIVTDLQKILFATDEEEVTVNDDGTVSVVSSHHD